MHIISLHIIFYMSTCHFLRANCLLMDEPEDHRNITDLLDRILDGYDNHLRPDFGGPPTEVFIDLHVRSMGLKDDMTYSMDCYFRQTWKDERLAYSVQPSANGPLALALAISMLDRIWKPDTYFYNGKNAYMHTITVPNKFVRVYTDGRILYSSRMTIKASCPMKLENFPMDTQRCPLELGSFGYSNRDVVYRWNPARRVVIAPDMKMSQFDLIATPSGNQTGYFRKDGPYSRLIVSFHFERHMGGFLIEIYVPCIMLVVLSWVSFWINREATADRVALGIMTMLTMTFMGLESRNDLPKVPYLTALDYFVAITFAFIFATIIEFAVVHYYTKVGSGEHYFSPAAFLAADQIESEYEDQISEEESDGAHAVYRVATRRRRTRRHVPFIGSHGSSRAVFREEEDDQSFDEETPTQTVCREDEDEVVDENICPVHGHYSRDAIYLVDSGLGDLDRESVYSEEKLSDLAASIAPMSPVVSDEAIASTSFIQRSVNIQLPPPTEATESPTESVSSPGQSISRNRFSTLRASINRGLKRTFSKGRKPRNQPVSFQLNSVSQIDRISRVIFPLTFIVINFVYWFGYLRAEIVRARDFGAN